MTYTILIGPSIAALGILAGYYYFRKQNARIQLDITYSTQNLIEKAEKSGLYESLEVIYKETKVKDPRVIVLKVSNQSSKDLESKSFDQDRPIRIGLGNSTVIAEGSEKSSQNRALHSKIQSDELLIGPDLIRQGTEHTITLVVDGEPTLTLRESNLVNCDVAVINEGKQGTRAQRYKAHMALPAIILAIILTLLINTILNRSGTPDPGTPERQALNPVSIDIVIQRAMSQLDTPYSWGGGSETGPTLGIRDGGVADKYGDYKKIGFDSAGLMIYAFGGLYKLPHYTGYQYTDSNIKQIPYEERMRGDMIFYGPAAENHVALYMGDNLMIEALKSGEFVKISEFRESGISTYVARPLAP